MVSYRAGDHVRGIPRATEASSAICNSRRVRGVKLSPSASPNRNNPSTTRGLVESPYNKLLLTSKSRLVSYRNFLRSGPANSNRAIMPQNLRRGDGNDKPLSLAQGDSLCPY